MRKVEKIILHCSASDYKGQTARWIHDIHVKRGFKTIGYHYFITPKGIIEMGRPLHEVGAHVKGHNTGSIGICLAGNKTFIEAQFKALRWTLTKLYEKYPDAEVYGHYQFDAFKTCPNFDVTPFKKLWKELRDDT